MPRYAQLSNTWTDVTRTLFIFALPSSKIPNDNIQFRLNPRTEHRKTVSTLEFDVGGRWLPRELLNRRLVAGTQQFGLVCLGKIHQEIRLGWTPLLNQSFGHIGSHCFRFINSFNFQGVSKVGETSYSQVLSSQLSREVSLEPIVI